MKKFPELNNAEFRIFKKLNSPAKIQDYINSLPANFEKDGISSLSPLMAIRNNTAHCMEGALIAAAALWYHGQKPLLMDLKVTKGDDDHVVALFKQNGYWGSISKTNHGVLRYRDPIFKTLRELVLSYFNEYFLDTGKKTLRSYSRPFSLLRFGTSWLTSKDHLWKINNALDDSPHIKILTHKMEKSLRRADNIEIETGKLTEWKKN